MTTQQTPDDQTHSSEQSFMEQLLGDFAPKFVSLTDNTLYGDVWARPELSGRDRSIIAVSAFVGSGNAATVEGYVRFAQANGVSKDELVEILTHLAFYSGWPQTVTAMNIAKTVFTDAQADLPTEAS